MIKRLFFEFLHEKKSPNKVEAFSLKSGHFLHVIDDTLLHGVTLANVIKCYTTLFSATLTLRNVTIN